MAVCEAPKSVDYVPKTADGKDHWFVLHRDDTVAKEEKRKEKRLYSQSSRSKMIEDGKFDSFWNALRGGLATLEFLADGLRAHLKTQNYTAEEASQFCGQDCGVELDFRLKEEEEKVVLGTATIPRKINIDVYFHFGDPGPSYFKDPTDQADFLKTKPPVDKKGTTWKLIFHIERTSIIAHVKPADSVSPSQDMLSDILVWIQPRLADFWKGLQDKDFREAVSKAHEALLASDHPTNRQLLTIEALNPHNSHRDQWQGT